MSDLETENGSVDLSDNGLEAPASQVMKQNKRRTYYEKHKANILAQRRKDRMMNRCIEFECPTCQTPFYVRKGRTQIESVCILDEQKQIQSIPFNTLKQSQQKSNENEPV